MYRIKFLVISYVIFFVELLSILPAQNDTPTVPEYQVELIIDFDHDVPGTWTGKKDLRTSNLLAPMYVHFKKPHQSAFFNGETFLNIKESELKDHNLRFVQGDTITLAAWVNLQSIKEGQYAYIVGKGRNQRKGYSDKNQNYGLRVQGKGGIAYPNFLFSSETTPKHPGEFHRWTAKQGFAMGTGWHHLVVSYTYGDYKKITAYLDGESIKGDWDLGGATNEAPVADDDEIHIGTGYTKGASNTFNGYLDNIQVIRGQLPREDIIELNERTPQPPVVDLKLVEPGFVRVEICEGSFPKNGWPLESPQATETFNIPAFILTELPFKYISTGIREDRSNPHLVRLASRLKLQQGKYQFLLRTWNGGRLYLDEKQLGSEPIRTKSSGGHGDVVFIPVDHGPQTRMAPPGNVDKVLEVELDGKEHLLIFETMVGGFYGTNPKRPDVGETTIGIRKMGEPDFCLLTATGNNPTLTDQTVAAYQQGQHEFFAQMNTQRRQACLEANSKYWDQRREYARNWIMNTPPVKVPTLPEGYQAHNNIDNFIADKWLNIKNTQVTSTTSIDFHQQILPIFEAKCFTCHQGAKVKGNLRLDQRSGAVATGVTDSGLAGIVPGKADKSEILARIISHDEDSMMPPKGERISADEIKLLTQWINEGAHWPQFPVDKSEFTPLCDDLTFLRRLSLDTVGVIPDLQEIKAFLKNSAPDKRAAAIDHYLEDPRWADHWTGYWQDVLAENPNILNPTLNNSGPFRWWLYESLLDNKPLDIMVTELVNMEGSLRNGGPAGFSMASQNDVPMAAKATILSTAFMGVEMKCARCHDAPYHLSTQEELFSLGAMLEQNPLGVPASSSVNAKLLKPNSLISVSIKPGEKIAPNWPWKSIVAPENLEQIIPPKANSREILAACITAPQNERFAQVIVNRVWQRLMGRGFVEPVDDWERQQPTHPELLKWLSREFVESGYDLKHLTRTILLSHAYQRQPYKDRTTSDPFFRAPSIRRLQAEQIVDSLYSAGNLPYDVEQVSLDIDGSREWNNSLDLGKARRAWMFTSTSNERDRPSLSLPRIQYVVDVLTAFGWRSTRQDPLTYREMSSSPIQPAVLANSPLSIWVTRLSDRHGVTELALKSENLDDLINDLYLNYITRYPSASEKEQVRKILEPGFAQRVIPGAQIPSPPRVNPSRYVSWSNHLVPEATEIKLENEAEARRGDPPTVRLETNWRERLEDVVWSLVNSPEFIFRN